MWMIVKRQLDLSAQHWLTALRRERDTCMAFTATAYTSC